jgi:hypothetical protein
VGVGATESGIQRGGFHHSSYELAHASGRHALGRNIGVKDKTVAHEGDEVLELSANVRNVESAIDLENDVCTLSNLVAHAVVAAADVSCATSVAVTGCHCHSTLRVSKGWDSQGRVGIEAVEFLE